MKKSDRTYRVNFLMHEPSVEYIQSQLGLQSLASVGRRLLLLYANDAEVRSKVQSLDVDTQAGYEEQQKNKVTS